ncbi:MAG: 50S ribosomal protein L10 [Mycoplasmataceae bacterium]|jgi:large subunit ribosomal protein L10|nr:50S ribosomal protein L10 [Mycoplasmataceae bacterium]
MKAVIQLKDTLSKELAEDLKKAKSVILFEYLGLNARELTNLRRKLHDANAKMYVQKNNIFIRALSLAKIDGFTNVTGPNALLVAFGDEILPFKELHEIIKTHKFVKYKNGVLESNIIPADQLASLAAIPGREGLLSMLLSCLQASIRNLAYGIKAVGEHKQ